MTVQSLFISSVNLEGGDHWRLVIVEYILPFVGSEGQFQGH
jgi:hypothetical protein